MSHINSIETRLDAYVNSLMAPLESTLDESSLSEFRNNSLFHLECLVEEHRRQGRSDEEALAAALSEFGSAEQSGLAMLDEWCRGRRPSAFSRTSSSAVWWSFACFGIASGCSQLPIQLSTMWPTRFSMEPAAITITLIAPAIAGIAVGFFVPTGNLRALGFAFVALFVHALLARLLMGPSRGGALFLMLFICVWIPLGALAVTITSWLRRNRRLRRPSFPSKEVSL